MRADIQLRLLHNVSERAAAPAPRLARATRRTLLLLEPLRDPASTAVNRRRALATLFSDGEIRWDDWQVRWRGRSEDGECGSVGGGETRFAGWTGRALQALLLAQQSHCSPTACYPAGSEAKPTRDQRSVPLHCSKLRPLLSLAPLINAATC
ncbi:hypothetical protein BJY59DRAFT_499740 [Rhodotorula toruloides]